MSNDKAVAMMRAASEALKRAKANTGAGAQGEWPPTTEGDETHECWLTGVTVDDTVFRTAGGQEVPAIRIVFSWEWHIPQDSPFYDPANPTLNFDGAHFRLVPNLSQLPDDDHPTFSSRRRAEVEWERLKGHLTKILGSDYVEGDLYANISLLQERLNQDAAIICGLRVTSRTGKGNSIFHTEFVRSCSTTDMEDEA